MVSPLVRKLYPKSLAPDLTKLAPKSAAIAARTALFEQSRPTPQETPTSPGSSEGTSYRFCEKFWDLKLTTSFIFLIFEATNEAEAPKQTSETTEEESMSSINEDSKEEDAEEEGSLPTFPYERLKLDAEDPASDIDLTKREVRLFKTVNAWNICLQMLRLLRSTSLQAYMTSADFKEKFEMTKSEFYKLPKWKQNKLKMAVQLFWTLFFPQELSILLHLSTQNP